MKKKKEKRTSEDITFEQRKDRIQRLITNAQNSLATAERTVENLIQNPINNPYLQQEAIEKAKTSILLLHDRIEYLKIELKLIRDKKETDIAYRKSLLRTYPQKAERLAVRNKNLRFHGASLIASLRIIKSGSISSAQERGLGQVSFDGSGQISVTDLRSIALSIRDYTSIKDQFIPMGCLFVVTPQNRADARTIRSYLMKSLKLKERRVSKRFVAVLCTPETLPIIQEQLLAHGYPPNLAVDYFEFLETLN